MLAKVIIANFSTLYKPLVGLLGIEPSLRAPEACVLPAYSSPSCPQRESNPHLILRTDPLYPLSYGDDLGGPYRIRIGRLFHAMEALYQMS